MFCTVFEMGQVLLKPKRKNKIAADNKSLEMFFLFFLGGMFCKLPNFQ